MTTLHTFIGRCCREWIMSSLHGNRGRCGTCGEHPEWAREDTDCTCEMCEARRGDS